MKDINRIIQYLRPESSWSITDNDYDTLDWFGPETKPTKAEIEAAESDAEVYWKRKEARLSKAAFKLGLLDRGELQRVKDFIAQTGDDRIVILWEDSANFDRLHPDLLRLANELGYTDEQLDELFGIVQKQNLAAYPATVTSSR